MSILLTLDFLSRKFTTNQLSNLTIYTTTFLRSFVLIDIVKNKVSYAINNNKTNSAPGPNGIPPKFIKMAKVVLIPVCIKLYHKCLKE